MSVALEVEGAERRWETKTVEFSLRISYKLANLVAQEENKKLGIL